jgi:hypothetical protein
MEPMSRPQAIIDFCLAPLKLDPNAEATREVMRRMEHVIKTFQARVPQTVSVDFARMPALTINEAAHGYE